MRPSASQKRAEVCSICRTLRPPDFDGNWSGGVWAGVQPLDIRHFHPAGSEHRPITRAKLLFDDAHLYVMFRVQDRYVRAVAQEFQGRVWEDSCAEAFLQPRADRGYFNFEMNCGGTLRLSYIEDPRRTPDGFARFTRVAAEQVAEMQVYHSLPAGIDPEIPEPVLWFLEYSIPLSLFEAYLGDKPRPGGERWRGNFYICGDETSHPHWAAWSPIGKELNFHCPEYFGVLEFAG